MKILVGMSGGVDSSTTAVMLKKAGHDVVGIHLIFWNEEGKSNKCCNTSDLMWARKIADDYDFPFYTFDFREIFKESVVDYFLEEDHSRVTPNPCVMCNKKIKFGALIEKAVELGCDKIATGHYARIVGPSTGSGSTKDGKFRLKKAVDPKKDQSYFLHKLTQDKLAKAMFPLGDYEKSEVFEMAKEWGLINDRRVKKESQDLCFVPEKGPEEFLKRNYKKTWAEGDIVNLTGEIVGRHRGLPFYTIGQRRGLDIGGLEDPYYVVDKVVERNRLVVGLRGEGEQQVVKLKNVSLTHAPQGMQGAAIGDIGTDREYEVKIRYRGKGIGGRVVLTSDGGAEVVLSEMTEAVTPGQFLVIYDGDECLGGGEIV